MAGLLIFVESIRWLGRRWGRRAVQSGVRNAGFDGEFLSWKWHSSRRGWLVLPTTMNRSLLERQARRLAEFITAQRTARPTEPLHLIGYSFGGYIALRALELLPNDVEVDSAALLAAAFSPRRDLTAACRPVKTSLVIASSLGDAAIIGCGTLLFGAADGSHTFSVGMVGTSWRGPKLRPIYWRPGMIPLGHLGGHFTATAQGFIQNHIAPAMGIEKPPAFISSAFAPTSNILPNQTSPPPPATPAGIP